MEFPLHRSRASPRRLARRALRPRAREVRASDQRLRTDSTGTRGITLVAQHRPTADADARALSAPRHSTATRRDARRANERDARVDPFEPRRAAREETTVERAREEDAERFFERWMSC